MEKNLLNKKIPTLLAVFLLVAGFFLAFFLINKRKTSTFDSQKITPQKVVFSNIQENQLNVSWVTEEKTIGYLVYGKDSHNLNQTVKDDRQQFSDEKNPSFVHYVTIKDLQPQTTYYFIIVSNGKKFYQANNQPYQVTTAPPLEKSGEAKITSGKILNPDRSPEKEAIVYLTTENAALASCLTDNQGRWAIFLNKIRNADLSSWLTFDPEKTVFKVEVETGKKRTSALFTVKNAFPVPDITLDQTTIDFTKETLFSNKNEEKEKLTSQISQPLRIPTQFNLEPLPSGIWKINSVSGVTIDNPQEGEIITTQRPIFWGKGAANQVLTIKIDPLLSKTTATVNVDSNGHWEYSVSENLNLGSHRLEISWFDEKGNSNTISRNFTIIDPREKALPAFVATPTARISPSPSPLLSPSSSPIKETRVSQPSTSSSVFKPGNPSPTLIFLTLGLILLVIGGVISIKFKY